MKIDVHAHFYPKRYLDAVSPFFESGDTPADRDVQRVLAWAKSERRMWSLDQRLEDMARYGIDTEVLSLSIPNPYMRDKGAAVSLSQLVNDTFVEMTRSCPQRFKVFASVPMQYPEEAFRELERATRAREVVGIMLGANINGVPLNHPDYLPFYGELERRNLPFFIHPMNPPGLDCMMEFSLANVAGYLFDTSLAALRLVLAGVFERHPRLTMIFPHLGGVVPYMLGRVQWGYERFEACRANIASPPETYFKRFYYDTVCRSVPALRLAVALFGTDHVVYGTDFPLREDIELQRRDVEALGLTAAELEAVYAGNAARLLGISLSA